MLSSPFNRRLAAVWPTACLCIGMALSVSSPAHAQGFAAYITPPRFEIQATAGTSTRQVFEIQHVGQLKGGYRIYTNDWTFQPDNSVSFSDELAPDSCRPWVAIERRDLTLESGARYRFRFEITPPAGTPARECRFAIMVEGIDPAKSSVDVGGRIGVIVYAAIGGAAPVLEITATRTVKTADGKSVAMLDVRNSGNAHGRLEGYVNGTDADGQRLELTPADLPVMPGETRGVSLTPVVDEGKPAPEVRFPLNVQGKLEWGKNRLPLDASFAP
ncbi:MAG TPA: hypothetical protein VFY22_13890 [Hydrogenophaga sp.]|nr:hypothetical protein [Hydrogenophaga sp.]